MKNLIVSILMITGLSLSSQVNNVQNTKPTIITQPAPIDPNTGTNRITCTAGNAYIVANECACVNIHCTNGNNYIWCVCRDGQIFGGASGKLSQSSGSSPKAIEIPFDITYSVSQDLNSNLDPVSRVVNIKKIQNAIIDISSNFTVEYSDYILTVTAGTYEVKNNKLQTLSTIK